MNKLISLPVRMIDSFGSVVEYYPKPVSEEDYQFFLREWDKCGPAKFIEPKERNSDSSSDEDIFRI